MAKPSKIRKLGEAKYVRLALIAKSGFGKTVFSGTAPKALFLTTDPEGTVSARRMGSTAEEWVITGWDELQEAYRYLKTEGVDEYDWIVVDNITEAQAIAREQSIANGVKRRPGRDTLVPELDDYQRSQLGIVQFVKQLNDLPINIIYTSHRKGMEDGDGNDYYSAAIQGGQGSIAEQILGYMNVILFGEMEQIDGKAVRRYWASHFGPQRGKDRFQVLGNYKDNLTVPQMMELIEASRSTVKRPASKTTGATRSGARPARRTTAATPK